MSEPRPPKYILDAMGGSYDETRYRWDPDRMALVDRYTGATLSYGDIPDPSLGTDVVTNLSNYNRDGRNAEGTFHFEQGVNPFIAFPGESYNAGLTPNSGIFLSADPKEIAEYNSSARDRNLQGIARVGAVVGGGAALGATGSGPLIGSGSAVPASTSATTYPLATGGPVTAAPLASGGLAPISVSATPMAGGVPSVEAASTAAWSSANPTMASMPSGSQGGGFFDKLLARLKRGGGINFGGGGGGGYTPRRPVYQPSQPQVPLVAPASGPAMTTRRSKNQLLAELLEQ